MVRGRGKIGERVRQQILARQERVRVEPPIEEVRREPTPEEIETQKEQLKQEQISKLDQDITKTKIALQQSKARPQPSTDRAQENKAKFEIRLEKRIEAFQESKRFVGQTTTTELLSFASKLTSSKIRDVEAPGITQRTVQVRVEQKAEDVRAQQERGEFIAAIESAGGRVIKRGPTIVGVESFVPSGVPGVIAQQTIPIESFQRPEGKRIALPSVEQFEFPTVVRLPGEAPPTLIGRAGAVLEKIERTVPIREKVTQPAFKFLEERGITPRIIAEAGLGRREFQPLIPETFRQVQVGIFEEQIIAVKEKPTQQVLTFGAGKVLGVTISGVKIGTKAVAGAIAGAKGIGIAETSIKVTGITAGTVLGGAFVIGTGAQVVKAPTPREAGMVIGEAGREITLLGLGMKGTEKFIRTQVFKPKIFREPVPKTKFESVDVILRRVTEEGKIITEGAFKLRGITPKRKAMVLTSEEVLETQISRVFKPEIRAKPLTQALKERGVEVVIQPSRITISRLFPTRIVRGRIEEGAIGTIVERGGVTFSQLVGEARPLDVKVQNVFEKLPKETQKALQVITEERIGIPVTKERVPKLIGEEFILQQGQILSTDVAKVARTTGKITGIPLGKRMTRAELTTLMKEITPKGLEEKGIDIFETTTAVRDITFPFAKPRRLPVIKGITIVKEVRPDVETIGTILKSTQKLSKLKTDIAILQRTKAVVVAKLPKLKPISTKKILEQTGIKEVTSKVIPTSRQIVATAGVVSTKELLKIKQVPVIFPVQLPKDIVKELIKTSTAIIPKEAFKTTPKEITKEITKTIPKELTKQVTKTIPKSLTKQITKTIPKETIIPLPPIFLKVPPISPVIIPGALPSIKRKIKEKLKKKKSYTPQVKKAGKWKDVTKERFTEQGAFNFGSEVTDKSLAASFRVRKTKPVTNPKTWNPYFSTHQDKFRQHKIRKGKKIPLEYKGAIEKRGKRLDTLGEVKKITAARIAAKLLGKIRKKKVQRKLAKKKIKKPRRQLNILSGIPE